MVHIKRHYLSDRPLTAKLSSNGNNVSISVPRRIDPKVQELRELIYQTFAPGGLAHPKGRDCMSIFEDVRSGKLNLGVIAANDRKYKETVLALKYAWASQVQKFEVEVPGGTLLLAVQGDDNTVKAAELLYGYNQWE
jgi:hypothetical protein